ncbi:MULTISPECIES: GntR family transcriptional regulator [unclassified Marinovum]
MNENTIARIELPSVSATDQVFQALYDGVVSLKLAPGVKVSESEVAKQLDVSRQPVRDAFFRLSKLGFLSIRPQRATLISRISEQAVLEAVFTRTALEVECLRRVVQAEAANRRALHDNLAAQRAALDKGDRSEFHALDEVFHESLCQIAGHAHVWGLIREHKAHMDRIRFLTLSEERRSHVLSEHEGLVAAIDAGDGALAEARLRSHLNGIRTVLPEIRRRYPDYFDPPL